MASRPAALLSYLLNYKHCTKMLSERATAVVKVSSGQSSNPTPAVQL